MLLFEIDGMVNLISLQRAKKRHLILGECWWHYSARCEFFVENQFFAWADLPVCSGPTNTAKWNLEKWTKETQKLMAPLEWRRNRNFEGSKSYEALWTGSSGGNPSSTARKSAFEWRWAAARADVSPWRTPCVTTSRIHAGRARTCSRKFGPRTARTRRSPAPSRLKEQERRKHYQLIRCSATQNKKIR